jgi:hypothetical protein
LHKFTPKGHRIQNITLEMTRLIFKFSCMVYGKHYLEREKINKINSILWQIKQMMQHVLKMQ